MISSNPRKTLCMALLTLNLAFIWGNSLLPGSISGGISHWVGGLLQKLFSLPVTGSPEGHHLLRKLAHFLEFASLGMLLTWRTGMIPCRPKYRMLLSWLLGLAAACVDESIQIFVEGRACSLTDVWLDATGVAAGIGLFLAGYHFIRRK